MKNFVFDLSQWVGGKWRTEEEKPKRKGKVWEEKGKEDEKEEGEGKEEKEGCQMREKAIIMMYVIDDEENV